MVENIKWLGHASFKITGEKIIYIDPWKINEDEKADIILITHEHFDHCSSEDIEKIAKDDTTIVTVADCQSKVTRAEVNDVRLVEPGSKLNAHGIEIEAVHSYNLNKDFHPQSNNWVGFVITVNGKRIYHAGDTDNIPEMSQLRNIDVALVPVSGTYVMTAEEAAQAVKTFKPKLAIPMHYGDIVGTKEDAEKFKELAECEVEILES